MAQQFQPAYIPHFGMQQMPQLGGMQQMPQQRGELLMEGPPPGATYYQQPPPQAPQQQQRQSRQRQQPRQQPRPAARQPPPPQPPPQPSQSRQPPPERPSAAMQGGSLFLCSITTRLHYYLFIPRGLEIHVGQSFQSRPTPSESQATDLGVCASQKKVCKYEWQHAGMAVTCIPWMPSVSVEEAFQSSYN